MDSSSALHGLARLSGLLVREHDPLGVTARGLAEACALVSADASGVMVRSGDGELEVLAATSHRAADLEAYQAASENGPCVDSMRTRQALHVGSIDEANERWPGFGDRMASAGYHCAHVIPMSWQGQGIGGLNLFWQTAVEIDDSDGAVLQMFADILTVAVVHVRPVPARTPSLGCATYSTRGAASSRPRASSRSSGTSTWRRRTKRSWRSQESSG